MGLGPVCCSTLYHLYCDYESDFLSTDLHWRNSSGRQPIQATTILHRHGEQRHANKWFRLYVPMLRSLYSGKFCGWTKKNKTMFLI